MPQPTPLAYPKKPLLMRVNSANVLDEGLRIGGRGRQMNSNVKDLTNKAKLDAS
jgi:hypothetical protein